MIREGHLDKVHARLWPGTALEIVVGVDQIALVDALPERARLRRALAFVIAADVRTA
jgi:hypothetical protein